MDKDTARKLIGANRPIRDIIWDTKMWASVAASGTGELVKLLNKSISRSKSTPQPFTGQAVILPGLGYVGKLVGVKATDEIRHFTMQAGGDASLKDFVDDPQDVLKKLLDRFAAILERLEKEAVSALLEGCAQASRQMIRAQDITYDHEIWEGYPEERWNGTNYAYIGNPWEMRIHREFTMHDDPTLFKRQKMGFFGWVEISLHSTQPQNVWAIVE